jgi:hypothetical protein
MDGDPSPCRLQRVHDRQETLYEGRMYDDQGMYVRGYGRMVREDGRSGGSISMLVGTTRWIIPKGDKGNRSRLDGRSGLLINTRHSRA